MPLYSEPYILRLALIWARIHKVSSKLPSMVLLAFSGFIMNFAVSWVSAVSLQGAWNSKCLLYGVRAVPQERRSAAEELCQAGGRRAEQEGRRRVRVLLSICFADPC